MVYRNRVHDRLTVVGVFLPEFEGARRHNINLVGRNNTGLREVSVHTNRAAMDNPFRRRPPDLGTAQMITELQVDNLWAA